MKYTLFADEANPEQTDHTKFFVYGGIFVENDRISIIHDAMESLCRQYGLAPHEQIKFNTRAKPDHMSAQDHTALKTAVMALAAEQEVKFCGYAILHAIARTRDHRTLVEWGGSILLAKYNQFLHEHGAKGWATFDRINTDAPYQFLKEKFQNRVQVEGEHIRLENIVGYSFSCDGASHMSSLADVIIGGFRYVMNEPERDIAGRAIVQSLNPLWWHIVDEKGDKQVGDRGLVLRPRGLRAPTYQADYQEVVDRLTNWCNAEKT